MDTIDILSKCISISDTIRLYNALKTQQHVVSDVTYQIYYSTYIEYNIEISFTDFVLFCIKYFMIKKGLPSFAVEQKFDDIIRSKSNTPEAVENKIFVLKEKGLYDPSMVFCSDKLWRSISPLNDCFDESLDLNKSYKKNYAYVSYDFEKYYKAAILTNINDRWKREFGNLNKIQDNVFYKFSYNLAVPSYIYDIAEGLYLSKYIKNDIYWPFMTSMVPDHTVRKLPDCPILCTDDILKLEIVLSYVIDYKERDRLCALFFDSIMKFTRKDINDWLWIKKNNSKKIKNRINVAMSKKKQYIN
jgi:hypothetical protein